MSYFSLKIELRSLINCLYSSYFDSGALITSKPCPKMQKNII